MIDFEYVLSASDVVCLHQCEVVILQINVMLVFTLSVLHGISLTSKLYVSAVLGQ